MKLSGIALQLAAQTELKEVTGNEIVLAVPEASRHLTDKAYADKLKAAVEGALGKRVRMRFEFGGAATATLAAQEKRKRVRGTGKYGGRVSRRSVRAGCPGAVQRQGQARFDQTQRVT